MEIEQDQEFRPVKITFKTAEEFDVFQDLIDPVVSSAIIRGQLSEKAKAIAGDISNLLDRL